MRVRLKSLGAPLSKKSREAGSGAFSAFRVSEWSVRRKVVAVLAIPVVLAAVFGGLRVSTEVQDASSFSTNQQRATVLGPAIEFLTATERLGLPTQLSDALGQTQGDAIPSWTKARDNLKAAASKAGLTAEQKGDIESLLTTGTTLETGSGAGLTATAPVQMADMTHVTNQLITSTVNTQGVPDPRVLALIQSLDGRLSLVKQQLLIQSNSQVSSLLSSVWLAAEIGAEGSALDNLQTYATGRRVANLYAANATRLGLATSDKVHFLSAHPRLFIVYDKLNNSLLTGIQQQLAASAQQAKSRALTDTAIILTALLASLLLALYVARALLVPLRKVRHGALDVANERLPETVARIRAGKAPEEFTPIPVHSHDELGQLARAVDDMHRQAVTLATGEAQLRTQVGAMFVTLSRRNTTLVNQQLALIESLEQDEEDPQRLEQLFSLDHLATRMRRTAESLVILGGVEGRTAGFEAISVSDVVHAAVSEVQDYQRVRIDTAPDRMIAGRAASDVVHLMAELIDNALSYSPPGSPVSIQAAEDDGKVEVEIVDNGLGMAGEALAQANEALKNGGEVTVDTARRMGLFVVSRLAEEHGLRVKLRRNTNGGGIIASITLPAAVLVSDAPVEHVSLMDAPEVTEPEALVRVEEPEEEYDPYLERIEEAIAAVTGLPRRRPGATPGPALPPVPAAVSMFDAGPTPELPAGFEPVELPSLAEQPSPLQAPAAELGEPADDEAVDDADEQPLAPVVVADFGADRSGAGDEVLAATSEEEPEGDSPEPHSAVAEYTDDEHVDDDLEPDVATPWSAASAWGGLPPTGSESVSVPAAEATEETTYDAPEPVVAQAEPEEAPVRLQIRRPQSATPAASVLEGEYVADDDRADSPIFGQLQSNWLSAEDGQPHEWSANEVDRGWNAADRAESDQTEETTRTGLPVRRPGGRLVPGGVSTEPTQVVRDPEAIRNRLAAHAAGVSRGRAAATAEPITDDYAHEETGPA
jgi:signal transduction histidine kinase